MEGTETGCWNIEPNSYVEQLGGGADVTGQSLNINSF